MTPVSAQRRPSAKLHDNSSDGGSGAPHEDEAAQAASANVAASAWRRAERGRGDTRGMLSSPLFGRGQEALSVNQSSNVPSLVVHGGAGPLDEERVARCVAGCEVAAAAGWQVLIAGGSALDAVEEAVRVLEGNPEFNAGYGSTLNRDGNIEVDAALMDGSLRAGAVAAVPFVRHPITLARKVLDENQHVLLVAEGALAFGREHGIEADSPSTLITPRARARWEKERSGLATSSGTGDTVGAVARDREGRLAAASSTGGLSFKRPGRVGDSPLVGAGLYARNGGGAATATGHGESILRVVMCKTAVDALLAGASSEDAARRALDDLIAETHGAAGLILVDKHGHVAHVRNTSHMPWASIVDGARQSGA